MNLNKVKKLNGTRDLDQDPQLDSRRTLPGLLVKANEELKQAQNQLIQMEKTAAVGRLAFSFAHQIRNPLSVILQGIEVVEDTVREKDEITGEIIEQIKKATHKANNIIVDFLKYSRPSKKESRPVNISDVLDEAIALIKSQARLSNVKIDQNYPEKIIRVKAGDVMLQQAFFNLFTNAIDAMPSGGELNIRIYLEEEPKEVTGRKVTIEVEDTGKGIPEDELTRIFDPFYTTKEQGKGIGLGLSTVRLIVGQYHGTIDVHSEVNKGTKFIIQLPAEQSQDRNH